MVRAGSNYRAIKNALKQEGLPTNDYRLVTADGARLSSIRDVGRSRILALFSS